MRWRWRDSDPLNLLNRSSNYLCPKCKTWANGKKHQTKEELVAIEKKFEEERIKREKIYRLRREILDKTEAVIEEEKDFWH